MNDFKPLNAVRHPLWWAMLALLVTNDFILKSADFVPGFISGKLSDFAGLMVFPLLLALIFGVSKKRTWIALHIAAAIGFAAVKLFPIFGTLYARSLAAIGLYGQIWYDPTDLAALAVLPVSCWVYPRLSPMFSAPRLSQALKLLAIGIAGFACLASATSAPPRSLTTFDGSLMISDLTFINATEDKIIVSVERLNHRYKVDCTQPIVPEHYTKDQFEAIGSWTQKSGEAVAILPPTVRKPSDDPCYLVRLSIDDVESVLVSWDAKTLKTQNVPIQFDLPVTPDNMIDGAIVLHRNNNDYYLLAKGQFNLTYWRKDMFAVDYWKM